jgi:hypothetical protein
MRIILPIVPPPAYRFPVSRRRFHNSSLDATLPDFPVATDGSSPLPRFFLRRIKILLCPALKPPASGNRTLVVPDRPGSSSPKPKSGIKVYSFRP